VRKKLIPRARKLSQRTGNLCEEWVIFRAELWCKGFEAASRSIAQYSAGRTEGEWISVTCVAVLVMNQRLYVASLGDCRAFLLRQQRIQQISVADSVVDKMIEQGVITYEELYKYPIDVRGPMRCLPHHLRPDLRLRLHPNETDEQAEAHQGMKLYKGDHVLLCTHTLYGWCVTPEDATQLRNVLLRHDHPQEAVEELEALARQKGDPTNITIIALKIPQLS
jgi:protein phosphatase